MLEVDHNLVDLNDLRRPRGMFNVAYTALLLGLRFKCAIKYLHTHPQLGRISRLISLTHSLERLTGHWS